MEFCGGCGASKGAGGACPVSMSSTHSFKKGNKKMACERCNKKVGGKGSVCKNSMSGGHHFV